MYWYYKSHKQLKEKSFAGLVGTNTIRQNYSRVGSLDYIVNNGETIINAVSSQDWPGSAAVFVSIVSWRKGEFAGTKKLFVGNEKGENLKEYNPATINSSLSLNVDTTKAKVLNINKEPKKVFQGQTHGHEGFLLTVSEAQNILKKHPDYSRVLKPFVIGDELVAKIGAQPGRFVIDFTGMDVMEASQWKEVFKLVQEKVLPDRKEKGEAQEKENKALLDKNPKAKVNKQHINFLNNWWKLSYGREDLLSQIHNLGRYIA